MARMGDDVVARGDGPPQGTGGTGGTPAGASPGQRWLARLAFAAAASAALVLLLSGALKSVTALLLGFAGLAIACAAAWWFLANRGVLRWLASAVLVAAPVFVIVVYVIAGLLWEVTLAVALAAAAVAAGRATLSSGRLPAGPREHAAAPQQRPFLIMNPRSGGGRVAKFGLKDKATALGAEVALLEGPGIIDVAALARQAVDGGADLLGVAGGDGTQALIAGIAAGRDIPMLVISAGTCNHFALDLGLDRDNPSTCLDALTDGVELRIDLGLIGLSADERAGPRTVRRGQAGPHRPPQKPRRRRRGWRAPVAVLLIVAGCVLAPLSVVAVWTANQVSDTSRYVANVEPLIKDPAIQNALTDKITGEIVTRIM
jgi:hypothetical protein